MRRIRNGVAAVAWSKAAVGVGFAVLSLSAAVAQTVPAADKKPETVIVIAPQQQTSSNATVEVHGDDSGLGKYVVVWPKGAYQRHTDGEVKLNCLVDPHGLAESCTTVSESPPDFGFGRAALELRPTFKLQPALGPDGPVSSMMAITIRFKAPYTQFDSSAFKQGNTGGPQMPPPLGRVVTGNPLEMRDVTMMDHPIWVRAATFEDVAAAYPVKAGTVEGYAVAHCHVKSSGDLATCQIIKETPADLGFGEAALHLTTRFQVLPELASTPTRSALWVDIPIRFPPPDHDAGSHNVMAPIWLVRFDPDNAPKVFPPEAAAKGLTSGFGVAQCVVGSDGGLTGCTPGTGDPDGQGFSEAAVSLASVMKMNLWSADASPVVGAKAVVRIQLNLK